MEATVHFYDDDTQCVLAVPRDNGGVNNIIFEAVSSLVNSSPTRFLRPAPILKPTIGIQPAAIPTTMEMTI